MFSKYADENTVKHKQEINLKTNQSVNPLRIVDRTAEINWKSNICFMKNLPSNILLARWKP